MRRGGCAAKKKLRSHLSPRRRVVLINRNDFVDQHHPSRRYRVGNSPPQLRSGIAGLDSK